MSAPSALRVSEHIDSLHDELWRLAERIRLAAEVAFEEVESAAALRTLLAAHGLAVDDVADAPATSFVADAGSRGPLVVLCAEYDALHDLGHVCGHQLIAAAAAGAGIALARLAAEVGLRVRVVGCPAEESGGGKELLLQAGAFEGAACALMVHPGTSEQSSFSSYALSTLKARFVGHAGHPVRDRGQPEAADARLLAENAMALVRHRLPDGAAIPWSIADTLGRPSVRQAEVTLLVEVRARGAADLIQVTARVVDCLRGAALAAGCELVLEHPEPDYLDFRGDPGLADAWAEALPFVGRFPGDDPGPYAVTDMGNVSHRIPSLHAVMALGDGQAAPHEPAFADLAADEAGRRWIRDASTTLALTVLAATERFG